ncbi:hypothetical protein HK100_000297 [Physocladia obscura]|uniref:Transmembrane protein n=1 Tax=Physocladia obscura TaxID=109957 RepID=A0AAD5SYV2_9FUNG|nr:hypothetical protein HK100_000297 [Physocladia obscura]
MSNNKAPDEVTDSSSSPKYESKSALLLSKSKSLSLMPGQKLTLLDEQVPTLPVRQVTSTQRLTFADNVTNDLDSHTSFHQQIPHSIMKSPNTHNKQVLSLSMETSVGRLNVHRAGSIKKTSIISQINSSNALGLNTAVLSVGGLMPSLSRENSQQRAYSMGSCKEELPATEIPELSPKSSYRKGANAVFTATRPAVVDDESNDAFSFASSGDVNGRFAKHSPSSKRKKSGIAAVTNFSKRPQRYASFHRKLSLFGGGNRRHSTEPAESLRLKSESASPPLEMHASVVSARTSNALKNAHSFGSSVNISTDLLGRVLNLYESYKQRVVGTAVYQYVYACVMSTRLQIYLLTVIHTADLLFVVVLVIWFIAGKTLSSIRYYNLIHEVLGLLGKVGMATGFVSSQLIAKEYTAKSLIRKGKGITLDKVALQPTAFAPEEGSSIRRLFLASLFLVEGAMWFLILNMKWTAISTELGIFPCIPATYPNTPIILADLPGFLEGDASLSVIYNYGLPLADGLIGGWAAWPQSAPSAKFAVEGTGIVYAYSIACGDLRAAENQTKISGIQINLLESQLWTDLYYAEVQVLLPAGLHNWNGAVDQVVSQKCVMQYVTGDGEIAFTFFADEWLMVTGGQMNSITLNDGEHSSSIVVTQNMAGQQYFFDDITPFMGPATKHASTIMTWFSQVFTACTNGTSYPPTQSGSVASLFQWGHSTSNIFAQEIYDVNSTWEGLAGAVGSMSHYLMMQYNGSASANCSYFGIQQAGVLNIPNAVGTTVLSAVLLSFVLQTMQLILWALTSGGSAATDRVVRILDSPLLLLFYLRRAVTPLIGDIKSGDHSTRAIRAHMKKISVRLGEAKATRGEPIGTLIISDPRNVLAMSEKREYY